MPSWSRVATRMRVPVSFVFAAVYLWLARPTWIFITAGSSVVLAGLGVRALASGHIRKNAELATTGPYAHTRNPLYLGSILIALGFIVAARSLWAGAGAIVLFVVVYVPVIRAEENYLRSEFADYTEYAQQVPRFLPRLTQYRSAAGADNGSQRFSPELYMRHREYNAALGAFLMIGALILKMMLVHP
jgi:protein-S-isoprenylcysteine O-methyltransferase Ste14